MKIHLAVSRMGFTPDSIVTGHLCGREHGANDNENNVTEKRGAVTCACCLKILGDKKHWRHRKYLESILKS